MFWFLFILESFLVGSLFLGWLDRTKNFLGFKFLILAFGLGLVIAGYAVLFFGIIFGQLKLALLFFEIFSGGFFLIFNKKIFNFLKERFSNSDWKLWPQAFGLLVIFSVLAVLILQAMIFDAKGYPFGILKGWGDGAYHLGMVERLKTAEPFWAEQSVAGGRFLTYPFLINFLSAIFSLAGLSQPIAWHLPTLVFSLAMVTTFLELGRRLFEKRILAWFFVGLVLFGGGLGFFKFFGIVAETSPQIGFFESLKQNLKDPAFEYTHLDSRTGGKPTEKNSSENIVWITPAISFFSHQRSFALGGFLGALFLLGFLKTLDWRFLSVLAFLPLAHAHTFLALFILAGLWVILSGKFLAAFNKESWLAFFLALPQVVYLFYALSFNGGHQILPWFGWMTCPHNFHWYFCDPGVSGVDSSSLIFWLKNFGLVFIFWVISLLFIFSGRFHGEHKKVFWKLAATSIILFAIPNLFLLQPWEFDNNKFIFWWWVAAILLALSVFDRKVDYSFKKTIFKNFVLGLFVTGVLLSGGLDILARLKNGLKLEANVKNFGYYGEREKVLADWIKINTRPNDIFLTSQEPTQIVPILSGRPIYLGFTGWLWTQGAGELVSERQQKINVFVETGNPKELCSDGVKYWLFDQAFLGAYPRSSFVMFQLEEVFSYQGSRIFRFDCK